MQVTKKFFKIFILIYSVFINWIELFIGSPSSPILQISKLHHCICFPFRIYDSATPNRKYAIWKSPQICRVNNLLRVFKLNIFDEKISTNCNLLPITSYDSYTDSKEWFTSLTNYMLWWKKIWFTQNQNQFKVACDWDRSGHRSSWKSWYVGNIAHTKDIGQERLWLRRWR